MNKLKAFQIKSIKHLENSIFKILKISLNEIATAEFIFVLASTDFQIAALQLAIISPRYYCGTKIENQVCSTYPRTVRLYIERRWMNTMAHRL